MAYRKPRIFFLLMVLIVSALLSGCSSNNGDASEHIPAAWDIADAEPEYLTQWPENAFTSKVAEPQSGTIDYVLDYSDSGRYAIFMKDISTEESSEYIQTLINMGYSETHAASNDVSAGIMLERDDAVLSISYSEGVLGVLITIIE